MSIRSSSRVCAAVAVSCLSGVACAPVVDDVDDVDDVVKNADVASVDRFQDSFATLFKRSGPVFDPTNVQPIVPAVNEAFDVDALFRVSAFGPAGELVDYYSFDIISNVPQKGYFFVDDKGEPIAGQLPVLSSLPGADTSDFVRVTEVTVGADFERNSLQSAADVVAAADAGDVTLEETDRIENWVIVPDGTTAAGKFKGKAIATELAWVGGDVAHALTFEKNLVADSDGTVPTSGIVVIFANDTDPTGGFAVDDNGRTHNALETLADDAAYSSLWFHQRGGLDGFDDVTDYATALDNVAGELPVSVNCPVLD